MRSLNKLVTRVGLIALFSVMPLAAQVIDSVKFTTPFSFYAGGKLLPSGTYLLTQPQDLNLAFVVIRSLDGRHIATAGITPSESLNPPSQSKIIFEKYGDTLYFDRVLIQGDPYGITADATKAEKRAEQVASVAEGRSVAVAGQ